MPQPLLWQQYTLGLGPGLCLTCEMGDSISASPVRRVVCVAVGSWQAVWTRGVDRQAGRCGVSAVFWAPWATLSAEETVFLLGMGCLDALFRKREKEMGLLFAV